MTDLNANHKSENKDMKTSTLMHDATDRGNERNRSSANSIDDNNDDNTENNTNSFNSKMS